jgi:hypothetical protein
MKDAYSPSWSTFIHSKIMLRLYLVLL